MSEQLTNYILSEIRNGHQTSSIESFLKTHGYDPNDISVSIKTAIDLTAKTYIPYIQTQVSAGYDLQGIRTALVKQGYDPNIVDYAINHYFNNFLSKIKQIMQPIIKTDQAKKSEEERNQINTEIKQHLHQGLTLENIRSTLSQKGFNQATLNQEINKLYHSHFHISKQSAFAIIAIFFAVLFVGGFGFMLFSDSKTTDTSNTIGSKSETKLLDVNVENAFSRQKIYAGDNLNFNIDIDNMGTDREYDLYFTYSIEDKTGKRIRTKKVTKSTISSMNDYIIIPKTMEPGTYRLKVSIEYQGDIPAESYFEFRVSSKQAPEEIETKPETNTNETKESQKEIIEEVKSTPLERPANIVTPLEPGSYLARSYLTDVEKQQLIKYIDTEGIDFALFKCRQISFPKLELECKYYAILKNNEQSYCSILDEGIRRDRCNLEFAKKSTDIAMCSEIVDKIALNSCKMHILNNKNKLLLENENPEDFYKTFNEIYGTGTLNVTEESK